MKKELPNYGRFNKTIPETFKSLSKVNQKVIKDFLKYCQISSVHDKTSDKINRKVVGFADVVDKDLTKFTLEDLREFIPILNKSEKSKDYKLDMVKQIKRLLKWKFEDWSIRFKEFQDFKYMEVGKKNKQLKYSDLFTADEINFILKSLNDITKKTIIALLFETACRPEEVLNLKFKDIDYKNKMLNVYSNKTKQHRSIPLNESISHLQRYEREFCVNVSSNNFIFIDEGGSPFTSGWLSNSFKRIEKSLKLKKQFYPYILRHSTLQKWRLTLDPETYEKVSGHSVETALKFYGHLDSKQIRKQFETKIYGVEELTKEEKDEIKSLRDEVKELRDKLDYITKELFKEMEENSVTVETTPNKLLKALPGL